MYLHISEVAAWLSCMVFAWCLHGICMVFAWELHAYASPMQIRRTASGGSDLILQLLRFDKAYLELIYRQGYLEVKRIKGKRSGRANRQPTRVQCVLESSMMKIAFGEIIGQVDSQ